ncbi:hypothetical protein JAAARDRAFT_36721 [Jaapia argillacea MUCL 33604]|uniref:G-alpha-domain-containing protein n=1 Tax=Jaapia argillacea MUCL 33604 TaxID=933084 RepID=A0A067PMB6_9AGAM|nr:hypothetical protein JAAARDRAFT_36721 [Jaapia argillacea MUCL 33604]
MGRSFELDDPLALTIAPPLDETAEERLERETREAEARRISDDIDEMLRNEKAAMKKRRRPVKVLLLGQSESGKSTTLKNFQLTFARRAWAEERSSWKAVIQLNLVRSVIKVLDLVCRDMAKWAPPFQSEFESEIDDDEEQVPSSPPASPTSPLDISKPSPFTEKHRLLKLRLGPLRRVQKDLERSLGAESAELIPDSAAGVSVAGFSSDGKPARSLRLPPEVYIRSTNGWKSALEAFRPFKSESQEDGRLERDCRRNEATEVISECREDMKALWHDPVVRGVLWRRGVRMEETSGFFLNDIDRIATRDYDPSDDDVVRARLRTVGIQEHSFVFEEGRAAGHEWLMYDVGGARTSRAAWLPFFDDVDAIIFMAPISAFDEKLVEDRRVNRLDDTYQLWKSVVSSRLLSHTQIILFMNKVDILKKKIKDGVRVKDWVTSYGDRKNDAVSVLKYFQQHFKEISKLHSPEPRPFYVHVTSVVDTTTTATTLDTVEEGILRNHLRRADLL